jgi:tRNA-splicing ligase RtcB (3'-phosphate/5'-hydroxy nucleic acid ligase)
VRLIVSVSITITCGRDMEIIEEAPLPIYSWAPDLEPGALKQARNCASLPVAFHHIAVMADGHQGYGVPIGAVLALEDALSPFAVGNDIGCGMAIVPTTLTRDDLLAPMPTRSGARGPIARDDIMGWIQSSIPSGSAAHRTPSPDAEVDPLLDRAFDAMVEASPLAEVPLSTSQSPEGRGGQPLERAAFLHRGRTQLGTLGSGNHFIELLADEDGVVWLMLHSGSRGVGGAICNNFHRMALAYCRYHGHELPDPGLAWLPVADTHDGWTRVGQAYERALRAGLEYARCNRRRMLEQVAAIVERRFPDSVRWDEVVNIHHNDATVESHYGRSVWVHRKGAVKAAAGTTTITPGSMGTATYLGEGLGNPQSFESCSHGAGRIRSRTRARAELSLQGELDRVAATGGKVFATSTQAVLDEMPGAYKDLDEVMASQADLVQVVARLTPVGTYKGSEARRRRRRS